jgi:hypothetical protein
MLNFNNEKWNIERNMVRPRIFGRGAMMKHNIPLEDLRPPRELEDGCNDCLKLECDPEVAKRTIGRIRAFVQRHLAKLERNRVEKKDLPQFSIMFGKNKESILIWRTR